jgi:hypothetical protein
MPAMPPPTTITAPIFWLLAVWLISAPRRTLAKLIPYLSTGVMLVISITCLILGIHSYMQYKFHNRIGQEIVSG